MSFPVISMPIVRDWELACVGQAALDRRRESAVVQIDFSAAFDRASHSGLLYKFRDVGVGGAAFDVIAGFLSNRVHRVVVDGIRSENVRVDSGVPQGSVLGPLLFLLYTSDLLITLDNTLVGYAADSTLLAEIPEPRLSKEEART